MTGPRRHAVLLLALLGAAGAGAARAQPQPAASAPPLAIEGEAIHTLAGPVLRRGVVLVADGRITAVGPADAVRVPADAVVISARVVTPGLIDTHTALGLAGLYNVAADSDQDEPTDPDQTALRALDAFNPREPLLRYALEHGVTLVQAGPGPASPIGGQAGIFRTHGRVADEMVVRFPSALLLNLGELPKATYGALERFPSTRMGTAALIRRALVEGRAYARKQARAAADDDVEPPEPDLRLATLARVASGELPAVFTAHRADDVLTALRIAREFELEAVLAGASEAYVVSDAIRAAGTPVLVGPVMERVGRPETENASYENAAILALHGIPVALCSGFEAYVPKARLVLFEAAVAAANGLGFERALRAITLDAARILGVERDYGSIEVGKVADLVLFDGDPFEYTSHVDAVIAAGEAVYTRP